MVTYDATHSKVRKESHPGRAEDKRGPFFPLSEGLPVKEGAMTEYLVKLRYYPGDALEEIKERALKSLARKHGVHISYEKIENRQMKERLLMENTLDKKIDRKSTRLNSSHT